VQVHKIAAGFVYFVGSFGIASCGAALARPTCVPAGWLLGQFGFRRLAVKMVPLV
jgi:hypothetical protein